MERYLHVKITNTRIRSDNSRKSSTPFSPSEWLIVACNNERNGFLSSANDFLELESTPAMLVLQTPIRTRNHQNLSGDRISETHCEMKRSLPARNITTINDNRNLIGYDQDDTMQHGRASQLLSEQHCVCILIYLPCDVM
ncbi:hypothetical protein SESBI_17962 [Sesbania bispinosa]|nr:hypothetical protein SESBI_17962 [Sesbania bispinosa]